MASPIHQPESPVSLEPVRFHHTLLDGGWCPSSRDPGVELRNLVPVLDQIRGPVTRLLLSAAGWTARPHHVVTAGRTVSVGYLAGQSPSMMTVLCAAGDRFMLRVAIAGQAPGAPDGQKLQQAEWDAESGESGPLRARVVR